MTRAQKIKILKDLKKETENLLNDYQNYKIIVSEEDILCLLGNYNKTIEIQYKGELKNVR